MSRITDRLRSMRFASRGVARMVASEANARIHATATLAVVAAGFALDVDRGEWLALSLAIAIVWSAEALNTAIEAVCDVAAPGRDPRIERAKDIAAGAVLVAAAGAAVVGLLVFGPRVAAIVGFG